MSALPALVQPDLFESGRPVTRLSRAPFTSRSRVERVLDAYDPKLNSARQSDLINQLRELNPLEVRQLFFRVKDKGWIERPFPEMADNSMRRLHRQHDYAAHLNRVVGQHVPGLPEPNLMLDAGCGDGGLTLEVFERFVKRGGQVEGCDYLNYLRPEVEKKINFYRRSILRFLTCTPDEKYGLIMENVMLHHLSSKTEAAQVIRELVRVMAEGGRGFLTETTHQNWPQHFKNAILDLLLNDMTSRQISGGSNNRVIPVPLTFLSSDEIQDEITQAGGAIEEVVPMCPTEADPKNHTTFVFQK